MARRLALSTESPQEAEEALERLRAAGLDVEPREPSQQASGALTEGAVLTWELWVEEQQLETAAKLIAETREAIAKMAAETDGELEREALAAAPPPEALPVPASAEAKLAAPVDSNARLAGAVLCVVSLADVLLHLLSAAPVDARDFMGWGVRFVIGAGLWSGSAGARKVLTVSAVAWAVLGFFSGAAMGQAAMGAGSALWGVGMLVLMRGGGSVTARWAGLACVVVGLIFSSSLLRARPVEAPRLAPYVVFEGAWGRSTGDDHLEIGFCGDGRYVERRDDGKRHLALWKRTGPDEVEVTWPGEAPHRYQVSRHLPQYAAVEQLKYMASDWNRHSQSSICDLEQP